MKRTWILERCFTFGAAFAVVLALLIAAPGQQLIDRIAPADAEAIRAIAATLAPRPDRANDVLRSLNFSTVAQTIPDFAEWPALRKIETAYLSAVQAGGQPEGEKLLRAVSLAVAENHSNAVRYESALKPYFEGGTSAAADFTIKFAPISAAPGAVDARVRDAILAIERYVERVPGGMQSSMAACCGLNRAEVYDVLRSSRSRFEALTRAIESGNLPPALRDRLLRLAKMVAETTHALAYDKAFQTSLRELQLVPAASGHLSTDLPGQAGLGADQDRQIKDIIAQAGRNGGG